MVGVVVVWIWMVEAVVTYGNTGVLTISTIVLRVRSKMGELFVSTAESVPSESMAMGAESLFGSSSTIPVSLLKYLMIMGLSSGETGEV